MIVLETQRMRFRAHRPADLDAYCAIEADAEVRRFVGAAPRERAAAERKFRGVHLPAARKRVALRATEHKPDGRYIGYCGLYPNVVSTGPVAGEAVLAFYLARAYWGRGLATEAGRAFIDYGFGSLGLARILASVEAGNLRSFRVLEKLGFRAVGTETIGTRTFHNFEIGAG